MPARVGGKNIGGIHFQGKNIGEAYLGSKLVWSGRTVADKIGLDRALTSQYNVVLAGSSTTEGWPQPRNENYAHHLSARIVRHPLGADAWPVEYRNKGGTTSPRLSKGINFLNVGLGSMTSANYIDAARKATVDSFKPHVIIHMIGSNDYSVRMAHSVYKQNLEKVISSFSSTVQHVFVHSYRRLDMASDFPSWAGYGAVLKELDKEYKNVHFVDVSEEWERRRNGASDWLMDDKIHCTYKGSEALADAVANAMGLKTHAGTKLWGVTGDLQEGISRPSSLAQDADSFISREATSSSTNRPYVFQRQNEGKIISYDIKGLQYSDVGVLGGAFSFPITFYIVEGKSSSNTYNQTNTRPYFSRTINEDDSWWWVWRNANDSKLYAASNSAYSEGVDTGNLPSKKIIAVHMLPNGRAKVWANSLNPIGETTSINPGDLQGPWFKSLRLAANATLQNYAAYEFMELGFELGDLDTERVQERMLELSKKYDIPIS